MTVTLIITHALAVLGGAILWNIFGKKAQAFKLSEVALITSKIEALKTTETDRYNALLKEWNSFLTSGSSTYQHLSIGLKNIITAVKNV